MEAERLDDAATFLEEAKPLLLADEARHNLILGIAGTIRDGFYEEHRLWLVRDAGRPAAAALQTPPYNLILARPDSDEALAVLAGAVAEERVPGVVGAVPEAERFAELHAPGRWRRTMGQGVYELEEVQAPPRPSGASRVAGEADRDLVVRWFEAFADEVVNEAAPGHADAAQAVDRRYSVDTSGFLLWEDDGEPVSLAGWGGPTPNGIRVGPVYTPPALRGRGYATALTAELSQRLLEGDLFAGGRRFCFLYTDLANPTSN
ncbi:MAG TPA: GNAT family N-acetyltransferase, partial [Gaiellaceae bacterium]|nr:GNAT family N-acetyltransferase [Gaiellaceae bacterium]